MASRHFHPGATIALHYPTTAPSSAWRQHQTLIVLLPAHVTSGRLTAESGGFEANDQYVASLQDGLRLYGNLAIAEYSSNRVFNYHSVAEGLYQNLPLRGISRLVILGISMGGRVGTALIDVLREHQCYQLVQNGLFIAECAPWDAGDVSPLLKYGAWWRWPRWLNRPGYWLLNQLHSGYHIEPGAHAQTARHMRFMERVGNRARRGQMLAMLRAAPAAKGQYGDVPAHYLESANDPLVGPEAYFKYHAAFGGTMAHTSLGPAWHASHAERPSLYNRAIRDVLMQHGFDPA